MQKSLDRVLNTPLHFICCTLNASLPNLQHTVLTRMVYNWFWITFLTRDKNTYSEEFYHITLIELTQGVPWKIVLGPFLFDIYWNSSFYLPKSTGVCNFDDGTTLKHSAKTSNQNFKLKLEVKLQKLNFKSNIQIKTSS